MQDIGRGTHRLVAARYTFRRLFLAGLTALLADAVGFAVLMVIDIPVIRDLALTASIGVAVLIFTNLILLPVLLSYIGVSPAAAAAQPARGERGDARPAASAACWLVLDRFTERRWAIGAIAVAAVLARRRLRGQHAAADRRPRPGRARAARRLALQPRQRLHHRHYALSSDQFAVIVKTAKEGCLKYADAGRGRPPGLGAAAGAGRADDGVAGRRRAPDHRRHHSKATRSG